MGRVRSITILFSDYRRIVFILAEINKAFCGKSFNLEFRSSRNIWWCWRVTPVIPCIVLDAGYVTPINYEIVFLWQIQFLVILDGN